MCFLKKLIFTIFGKTSFRNIIFLQIGELVEIFFNTKVTFSLNTHQISRFIANLVKRKNRMECDFL